MTLPTNTVDWEGRTVTLTWIKSDSLTDFAPITQVYGICFDEKDRILVCRKPGESWQIPGGTPEQNESLEDTLRREFLEEVNVGIRNPKPLGVQQVDYPDNPNKRSGDRFYQARYICELGELLSRKPDPASGVVRARRFVPSAEITKYVDWGDTGAAMFKDAIRAHKTAAESLK